MKPDSRRAPPLWRRIAGPIVAVATLVFLGIFVARNSSELRAHEWSVRPGLLVLSIGLNILGLSWGVAVWQRVLRRMEVVTPYFALARVWFVSGLARYVPGKIWQFVGAAHLGPSAGIPSVVTVTSLAIHTGFFLLGAIITSIYLIPMELPGVAGAAVEIVRWIGPLVLLLAHPTMVGAGIRLVRSERGPGQDAEREPRGP